MKGIKYILMLLGLLVTVNVMAASPAETKDVSSTVEFKQGELIEVYTQLIYGNSLGYPSPDSSSLEYKYDSENLEFVSFSSQYDFKYDSQTMLITRKQGLTLPIYVGRDEEPIQLWKMTFKVKNNARVGDILINNKKYLISKSDIDSDKQELNDSEDKFTDNIENNVDKKNNFYLIIASLLTICIGEFVYIIVQKRKKKLVD